MNASPQPCFSPIASIIRPRIVGLFRGRMVAHIAVLILGTCTTLALASPQATTTTLAISSAGNSITTVAAQTVVTLTATVKAGTTALTTGQVKFCDASTTYCGDIHVLGAAQLTSAGTATLKFFPAIGSHSYKAIFVGTKSNSSSTSSNSALAVTSPLISSATTINQSGVVGNYTLTATVMGLGLSLPTGTVSFLDASNSNTVLGSAALGGWQTALNWLNPQSPATGDNPESIVAGDFNGDGIPDLAVANYGSGVAALVQ